MSDPPVKVVLIVGRGRSGSTILDNVLGGIEGFVSVGELHNLWRRAILKGRLCGCGVPLVENARSQRRVVTGAEIASRGRSFAGTRPESVLRPVTSNRITDAVLPLPSSFVSSTCAPARSLVKSTRTSMRSAGARGTDARDIGASSRPPSPAICTIGTPPVSPSR